MDDDYEVVRFTDADPPAVASEAFQKILLDRGVEQRDAPWIADALMSVGPIVSGGMAPTPASIELALEAQFKDVYRAAGSRHAGLVAVLLWAVGQWHVITPADGRVLRPSNPKPARLRRLLPAWMDSTVGLDFDVALEALGAQLRADENVWFGPLIGPLLEAGRLVRSKRLDPLRHLDLASVRASTWSEGENDISALGFWLDHAGIRLPAAMLVALEREPIESLAALALGFHRRLNDWVNRDHRPIPRERTRRHFLKPFVAMFQTIERRLLERPNDLELTSAYWVYACSVHMAGRLGPEARDRVIASATAALTEMRNRLRATPRNDTPSRQAFAQDFPRYTRASETMALLGSSIWPAMKLLLMALKEVPDPTVNDDLRYWLEGPDVPPAPWYRIPGELSRLIHLHVRREQEAQPDLRDLRAEFAEFCLKRVESKTKADERDEKLADHDMAEPSQVWRHCYVLAVRELRANPRRRGHRRLDWLAKNDPSEKVRREAGAAAKELRHGVPLPEGSSPRRALFAALWQIRQAQFLAPRGELRPGAKVDPDKARRTRQKEVQRTQELEDAERLS